MQNNLQVSVIIPVYNGEQFISAAIESILAQTYPKIEIVVVNDGSTDSTKESIKRYLRLPNFKYYEQTNRGIGAARNVGIQGSSGELIAFLDCDDVWLPEKLEIQVKFLLEHPDIVFVHTNKAHIDVNGDPVDFDWPTDAQGNCFKELFIRNRIVISTVLVRRDCLDATGLFNVLLTPSEDYDLWLRIAKNYQLGHINRTLVLYRFHPSNASRDSFRMTKADFAVITSIIQKFPDVYETLGTRIVQHRVGKLAYQLACWYMGTGRVQNHKLAKEYFWRCITCIPSYWPAYRWLIWCSISAGKRKELAWYWHKIKALPKRLAGRSFVSNHPDE